MCSFKYQNIFFYFIQEVGYNHGKTFLSGWERGGLISKLFQDKKQLERKHIRSRSSDPDMVKLAVLIILYLAFEVTVIICV